MALEVEDHNAASNDVISHKRSADLGPIRKELSVALYPGSAGIALVREDNDESEDKDEWYDIIDDMIDRDMNVLANCIGINTYRYVFENPA